MVRRPRSRYAGAFAALWMLVAGCAGSGSVPGADAEPPISVDRIRDTPEAFIGERVRLAAAVAEQYGSRMLALKDDDPAFKEQMLVITSRPLSVLLGDGGGTLRKGETLLVTGTVRAGRLTELERELGVQLDPQVRARYEGKPVLVASEIVRTGDRETEAPDTAPGY
jgi:hypothetical protein